VSWRIPYPPSSESVDSSESSDASEREDSDEDETENNRKRKKKSKKVRSKKRKEGTGATTGPKPRLLSREATGEVIEWRWGPDRRQDWLTTNPAVLAKMWKTFLTHLETKYGNFVGSPFYIKILLI
jgi:hypothetical protein